MEAQNDQDDKRSQIIERETGSGHRAVDPKWLEHVCRLAGGKTRFWRPQGEEVWLIGTLVWSCFAAVL